MDSETVVSLPVKVGAVPWSTVLIHGTPRSATAITAPGRRRQQESFADRRSLPTKAHSIGTKWFSR